MASAGSAGLEAKFDVLLRTVEHLQNEVRELKANQQLGQQGGGGLSPAPSRSLSPYSSPMRHSSGGGGGSNRNATAAAADQQHTTQVQHLQRELNDLRQIILRLDVEHGEMSHMIASIRELQSKVRICNEQNLETVKQSREVAQVCSQVGLRLGDLEFKLEQNVTRIFDAIPAELMNASKLHDLIDGRVSIGIQDAVKNNLLAGPPKEEDRSREKKLQQSVSEIKTHIGNLRIDNDEHRNNIKKVERHFKLNKTKNMLLKCREIVEKHMKMFRKRLFFRWKTTVIMFNERKLETAKKNFTLFLRKMENIKLAMGFKKWKEVLAEGVGHIFKIVTRESLLKELGLTAKGYKLRCSRKDWLTERVIRQWIEFSRDLEEELSLLIPDNPISSSYSSSVFGSLYKPLPLRLKLRNGADIKRGFLKWKRFIAIQFYPEPCYRMVSSKCDVSRLLPRGIDDVPLDDESDLAPDTSSTAAAAVVPPQDLSGADKLLAMVDIDAAVTMAVAASVKSKVPVNTTNSNCATTSTLETASKAASFVVAYVPPLPELGDDKRLERFGSYDEVEVVCRELIRITDSLKTTFLKGDYEIINIVVLKYVTFMNSIPSDGQRCMEKIESFVRRFNEFESKNAVYIGDVLKSMTLQFETNDKVVKRLRKDAFSKMGELEEDTLKSFKQVRSNLEAIMKKSDADMEVVTQEQDYLKSTNGRLDRLYLLHGEMMSKQEVCRKDVDDNTMHISAIGAARTAELKIREHLQSSLDRFSKIETKVGVMSSTTIPSLTSSQSALSRSLLLLQDALSDQKKIHKEFEALVDSSLNRHMLRPVTTQTIVSVYESFEKLVCEHLYLGKTIAFISGGPLLENRKIMRDLVDLSLNLAQQICNDVDKDSLYFLINGSNPNNGGNSVPILPSVYERRMKKVAAVLADLNDAFNRSDLLAKEKALVHERIPPSMAALEISSNPPGATGLLNPNTGAVQSLLANKTHISSASQLYNSKHRIEARNLFVAKMEKFLIIGLEKYNSCIAGLKSSLISKTTLKHPDMVRSMVSRCAMCDSCLEDKDVFGPATTGTTFINPNFNKSGLEAIINTTYSSAVTIPTGGGDMFNRMGILNPNPNQCKESRKTCVDGGSGAPIHTVEFATNEVYRSLVVAKEEERVGGNEEKDICDRDGDGSASYIEDLELRLMDGRCSPPDSVLEDVDTAENDNTLSDSAGLASACLDQAEVALPPPSLAAKDVGEPLGPPLTASSFLRVGGGGAGGRRVVSSNRPSSAGKFSRSINSQSISQKQFGNGISLLSPLPDKSSRTFAADLCDDTVTTFNPNTSENQLGGCKTNDLTTHFFHAIEANQDTANNTNNNISVNLTMRANNNKTLAESLSSKFLRDVSIPAQRNSNLAEGPSANQLMSIRPLSASSKTNKRK